MQIGLAVLRSHRAGEVCFESSEWGPGRTRNHLPRPLQIAWPASLCPAPAVPPFYEAENRAVHVKVEGKPAGCVFLFTDLFSSLRLSLQRYFATAPQFLSYAPHEALPILPFSSRVCLEHRLKPLVANATPMTSGAPHPHPRALLLLFCTS